MKIKILFFVFQLIFFNGFLKAQYPPFWSEIQAFKKQDSLNPKAIGQIVFTGSSSIRLWKSLPEDFKGYPIINRGFGGSSLPDVIRYSEEVILQYKPKQVVIYCGENDLAADSAITGKTVFKRFKSLHYIIHRALPKCKILIVAIKPSPSRFHLFGKMLDANKRIQHFIKQRSYMAYADIVPPMLNAQGKPREELFIRDRLHMNEKGYAIWTTVLTPYLLK